MVKDVRAVQVTIKRQAHGFGFDLDAELFVDEIDGLLRKLEAAGVSPANSPYVWGGQSEQPTQANNTPPICPIHGKPMKRSQFGDSWYCPRRVDDGGFCKEKRPA